MISLASIARLVNLMREFSPEGAQHAVRELYEMQQAINRMDANLQLICDHLGLKPPAVVDATALMQPGAVEAAE
jgi:hypothetical protein